MYRWGRNPSVRTCLFRNGTESPQTVSCAAAMMVRSQRIKGWNLKGRADMLSGRRGSALQVGADGGMRGRSQDNPASLSAAAKAHVAAKQGAREQGHSRSYTVLTWSIYSVRRDDSLWARSRGLGVQRRNGQGSRALELVELVP